MLKKIKTAQDADGIVFNKFSGHILIIDGDLGKVSVYLATAIYMIGKSANPSDFRHRYKVRKGSVEILFLDEKNK